MNSAGDSRHVDEGRGECPMEQGRRQLLLGTIICKKCDRIIAEQDTEKVIVYYVECNKRDCKEQAVAEREVQYIEA
ncbi:GapA-binding peptide SR1P [Paenibacillus alvei]|nr:GapA-binding peptide SR1P [Paenibacillus alvei]MCY9753533.1 GapA-binding peptide SR1P [Paenibacillus alvei]